MSLLGELKKTIDEARAEYEAAVPGSFKTVLQSKGATGSGLLVKGENMKWMKHMADAGYCGKINLVYIDPPFFSKANYDAIVKLSSEKARGAPPIKLYAYHDTWENGMEDYLKMLCTRFFMIRDLLADDGCLWIHLDWHAAHYAKVMLDEIFGERNFVNEVIWNYKSGGTSKRHFARKHDTLLFYSKTGKYFYKPQAEKSYNRGFKPYRFKGVKEYKDELGWYTMVNMKDVWQVDMVGRTSAERTGYATQKPEALLERIIEGCSREGDICADFFGGSGTLANVASRMNRKWISCDLGSLAFAGAGKRLIMSGADFKALEQTDDITGRAKCSATASVTAVPVELSSKKMLSVKLESYSMDVKGVPFDAESEKVVKKVAKTDPLSLIDYWSVDFNYDGDAHKPEMIFFSGREGEYQCEKIVDEFGRLSIHAVDVFGSSAFVVYEGKTT
ncbi:MAG: site-specific DNA-methyltransferase [Clostridiales bacterium]|nr:site-specific DNA-methyltransferase [Clostridiales bacterium]